MDSAELSKLLAEATPGPWAVDDGCEYIDDAGGFEICNTAGSIHNKSILRANARLIAAAPTIAADNLALRDVVRELVAHLRDFADTKFPARLRWVCDPQDMPDPLTELWPVEAWQSDARDLAAKAEGVL